MFNLPMMDSATKQTAIAITNNTMVEDIEDCGVVVGMISGDSGAWVTGGSGKSKKSKLP